MLSKNLPRIKLREALKKTTRSKFLPTQPPEISPFPEDVARENALEINRRKDQDTRLETETATKETETWAILRTGPTPSTVLSSINLIKPAIDTSRMEGQWPWLGRMARRGCPLFQAFNQCLVDRLHHAVIRNSCHQVSRGLGSRVREREKN